METPTEKGIHKVLTRMEKGIDKLQTLMEKDIDKNQVFIKIGSLIDFLYFFKTFPKTDIYPYIGLSFISYL